MGDTQFLPMISDRDLARDLRLTTGLIFATFITISMSFGLKLLKPNEQPFKVPSSTRPSSQPQNSAIWPSAGMCGLWTSSRFGMNPIFDNEPATDFLSSSKLCSLA